MEFSRFVMKGVERRKRGKSGKHLVVERVSKGCDKLEKKRLNCGERIDQRKVKIIIGRPEMKQRK